MFLLPWKETCKAFIYSSWNNQQNPTKLHILTKMENPNAKKMKNLKISTQSSFMHTAKNSQPNCRFPQRHWCQQTEISNQVKFKEKAQMQKSKNHFNVKILTDSSCAHSKGSQPKYKVQRTKMEKQNPKNDSKWENFKKKNPPKPQIST